MSQSGFAKVNVRIDHTWNEKEIIRANGFIDTSTLRRIEPEYFPVFHENIDSGCPTRQNARCT